MAYDFYSRLDSLGTRMDGINSVLIRYYRAVQYVEFNATPAASEQVDLSPELFIIQAKLQDWIVFTDRLVLDTGPIVPEHGDWIIPQAGPLIGKRFNIVRRSASEFPTFRYVTQTRERMRIYTEQGFTP